MIADSSKRQLAIANEEVGYLLEEIHNSFWVDFEEEDIVAAETVGDLFDRVVQKIGEFNSPQCLSSFTFFRLRRSLVKMLPVDRHSIVPSTPLRNLVPSRFRRAWWSTIVTDLRFRVPGLVPGRAAVAVYCATPALVLVIFTGIINFSSWRFLAIPVLVGILLKLASRLPRAFPVETVEDLVRRIVVLNQSKLAQEAGGSTMNQTWAAFRETLSSVSGIRAASISREMRFPEDLHR